MDIDFYMAILDGMPEGVTVQNRDFDVIYQNQHMREVFGDCRGAKCFTSYECRDQICERCGVREVFATGKPCTVLRTAIGKGGEVMFWENLCFPIFDGRGELIAGVEICRDVTNRVSLENDVKQRNVELAQLAKQLSRKKSLLETTLTELRTTQAQLIEVSRRAGMAEAAREVLKASNEIASEIELDRMLTKTLSIVIKNAGAEKGVLVEVGDGTPTLLAEGEIDGATVGKQGEPADESKLPLTVVNWVARTRIPVVLDNAACDKTYGSDPYIVEHEVRSLLCLPIVHKDSISAILYLENNLAKSFFTPDRLALLNSLAAQAAISMENARLYSRLGKNVLELERAEASMKLDVERSNTMLELNQMTGETPERIVDFAFEAAIRLTKSKIGYLAFMNEDETEMHMQRWSAGALAECAIPEKPLVFRVHDTGLLGEPVRRRRPFIINDFDSNPLKKGFPKGHVKVRRFISVPVIVGSRIVLVAGIGNKETDYDEADVRLLTLLLEGLWQQIERRKAQEAILTANERFRSVLCAAIGYSIISTTPNGLITVFNEGAEQMLGFRAEEVVDKTTPLLFHEAQEIAAHARKLGVEPGFEVLVHAARQGGTETREWSYVRKDGSRLTVLLTVAATRTEAGELSGFIGVARDITRERKMEQQLLQSQKMESVGLLAGGVSHDFNNLLTPILGYTDLLLMELSPDDNRTAMLQQVRTAAESAQLLTRRLLAFSRKQLIEPKPIDLGDIIRRFESVLRRTIREDIGFQISISPDLDLVCADAGQIEQVLLNLAVNAQDAMPDGGELSIAARNLELDDGFATHLDVAPGRYVMLSVSDTGVGMEEQTIEHVFEPFFTTKELGRGTGLGLSTVYGIVKQHGGSISVYSEKGHGTVFKILMPRVSTEGTTSNRPVWSEKEVTGMETIMVVEDNETVRELTCVMLKRLGYRLLSARSAEQCIELVKSGQAPIDLLLTDVIMPGMRGRELFDLLRQASPTLKVLFMSGYAENEIGNHGVLDKEEHFIQKPFSVHALSEKVRSVLDE